MGHYILNENGDQIHKKCSLFVIVCIIAVIVKSLAVQKEVITDCYWFEAL